MTTDLSTKERLMRELIEEIRNCKRCALHKTRRNPVPGEGSLSAQLMLVGEAPGYWEDVRGRPFVGAAGKLLNELLSAIGLSRGEVYIANILKCRPPGNRDPLPEEVDACTPFLDRQVELISPRVVVTLGRHSTSYFFSKAGLEFRRMADVHGKVYKIEVLGVSFSLIPTFHPASALYNPKYRGMIEEDLHVVEDLLRREGIL